MPLTDHEGAVVGVIQALNKRSGEPFNDYDEQVLGALCGNAAVAISNAQLVLRDLERQRLARDMELARQIQLGLLPAAPPQHAHWRLATYYQSCDRTGGDYFDFMPVRGGGLDAVIGDVSGHGIAAAMLMSTARAFLRALHEQIDEPGEMVTRLNRLLEEDMHDDGFMSLVLCRLEDDGHVSYVSAGHEPPLIHHLADGFAPDGESSGLPLGMMDDARYGATCVLRPLVQGRPAAALHRRHLRGAVRGRVLPVGHGPAARGHRRHRGGGGERGVRRGDQQPEAAPGGQAAAGRPDADRRGAAVSASARCGVRRAACGVAALTAAPAPAPGPRRTPHARRRTAVAMTPLQVLPGPPPPIGRCLFARSWPSRIDHKQEVLDTLVAELLGRGFITAEEEPWAVLVLDEVVVNAMLHGNEGDPTLSVVISLFADDAGRWVLTVRDQGQGFDPASLPDPEDPASLLLEHGRGIRIMKEWLAELVYYERGACAWLARQRADRPASTTPESP